jgi:predicted acetyltransferase
MDIEVRAITEDELPAYMRTLERAFGETIREEEWQAERRVVELDRSLGAFDGPALVGTAGAFSLVLTVPERALPMAGITQVAVQPTHRRRGVLTQLMRRQLEDVRDRGELIAGLWASESSIYRRFGYGIASQTAEFEIDRHRTAFARPHQPTGRLWLADMDEARLALPPVYDRAVPGRPGMLSRSEAWWDLTFTDLEHWRNGASALFFALHDSGRGVDAYAMYRVKKDWSSGPGGGTVKVREVMADTLEAYVDLWRFCFDIDLIEKIEAWPRPIDDPLLFLLAEPRRLNMKISDALWIRLVDLPAALAARRYSATGRVVFDVRDVFCPWNEGRFELEGGPDGADCRPTDEEPDISLDAGDLGAAYLGGTRLGALARSGRLEGEAEGLRRADAMFAWDPPPYCPYVF